MFIQYVSTHSLHIVSYVSINASLYSNHCRIYSLHLLRVLYVRSKCAPCAICMRYVLYVRCCVQYCMWCCVQYCNAMAPNCHKLQHWSFTYNLTCLEIVQWGLHHCFTIAAPLHVSWPVSRESPLYCKGTLRLNNYTLYATLAPTAVDQHCHW